MGRGVRSSGLARLNAPEQSKFLRRALKVTHVDHRHLGLLLAAVAHFIIERVGAIVAIAFTAISLLLHAGACGQRIVLQSVNAIVSLGCLRRLVETQFALLVDGLEGRAGGCRR